MPSNFVFMPSDFGKIRSDELSPGELNDIKESVGQNNIRETVVHEYGTRNAEAIRRYDESPREIEQHPYESDIRRIIFEKGYLRYGGKTQAVTLPEDIHVANRMVHCQRVGTEARSVARSLGYNQDLAEAIGLGHDLGHAPLGHLGEKYLSMATIRHSILNDRHKILKALGPFMHSIQSMMSAEWAMQQDGSQNAGLNLNLQTLHGFGSHDGESDAISSKWEKIPPEKIKEDIQNYYIRVLEESSQIEFKGDPNKEKDVEAHLKQIHKRLKEKKVSLTPVTPEASIVRIMDSLVYLAHDVNDYTNLCISKGRNPHFPAQISNELGINGRQILKYGIGDIVVHSFNQNKITYSKKKGEAIKQLKKFMYKNFYKPQNDKVLNMSQRKPWERMSFLFDRCTEAMEEDEGQSTKKQSRLTDVPYLDTYINSKDRDMGDYYRKMWHIKDSRLKIHQVVRDFISGCTDAYFYKITD